MSNLGWFTISGLACAGHTLETKKIWQLWVTEGRATDCGRKAIVRFARVMGFDANPENGTVIESTLAENAFNFLLEKHPGASKSYIMRQAIINHSCS